MENGIIVIEICERSLCSVTPCDSREDAIKFANELLESHCSDIGRKEALIDGKDEGDQWQRASGSNDNAWCNWRDMTWDAYIIQFGRRKHNMNSNTTELSYFDLLTKLAKDIAADTCMINQDRQDIENHINSLKNLLWKYSA